MFSDPPPLPPPQVFVLQDTELMKLVFSRPPAEVKPHLAAFRYAVQDAVPAPVSLQLYDTSYHGGGDGRIDFSSAAACFQIESMGDIYTAAEAEALLDSSVNARLEALFKQYHVQGIEVSGGRYDWCGSSVDLALSIYLGLSPHY